MNELEQWLADVNDFNENVCRSLIVHGRTVMNDCDGLKVKGKAAGLSSKKINSMLARVKLKVEMPEETGK